MLQKNRFKLFIWFISTSFFFITSVVLISIFNPAPNEGQIMMFMSGTMGAMQNSLMGISMTLENDESIKTLLIAATSVTIPLIIVAVLGSLFVRIRRS